MLTTTQSGTAIAERAQERHHVIASMGAILTVPHDAENRRAASAALQVDSCVDAEFPDQRGSSQGQKTDPASLQCPQSMGFEPGACAADTDGGAQHTDRDSGRDGGRDGTGSDGTGSIGTAQSSRYIVRFSVYRMAEDHLTLLRSAYRSSGGGGSTSGGGVGGGDSNATESDATPQPWQWISRDNKASAFPTDFGLISIAAEALAEVKVSPASSVP